MLNLLKKLHQFRECESGAISVDFVVITAGIVLLGFTVVNTFDEEVVDIADFEAELGIVFKVYKKADTKSIEENKALLWAKKIFKTKPNRTISENLRQDVRTVFHHLTKEELIEKVLANYLAQTPLGAPKSGDSKKKKNN